MALYKGVFWIAGNSVKDILSGNYKLICHKIKSDNIGNMLEKIKSKRSLSHKRLWNEMYKCKVNADVAFNYFPRGRIAISEGVAFINIIDVCNTQEIIDNIIKEYEIDGLEIRIMSYDGNADGGHRNFTLN